MKKTTFTLLFLTLSCLSFAQTVDSLEVNSLKVKLSPIGSVMELETKHQGVYKSLMYVQNLWIGGIDIGNQVKMSAQTFLQARSDFYPGPVSTDPNAMVKYGKVYKLSHNTINDFVSGNTVGIPPEIANWPAHGDVNFGEAANLAPFVDVNSDGFYNPADGDYPDIKGDKALFVMYHDWGTVMGGMGLEIHLMLYGFNNSGLSDSTLFLDYNIFNREGAQFAQVYAGSFNDFDLGNSTDDLMGTHVSANSVFAYNGSGNDVGNFGTTPAGCGIRILKGPPADYFDAVDNDKDGCVDGVRNALGHCISENPSANPPIREHYLMSNSIYYNNSSPNQSEPSGNVGFYNYLQSLWLNGTTLNVENPSGFQNTANGDGYMSLTTAATPIAYPGNSYDSSGAFEPTNPNNWFASPSTASDVRTLLSSGPFSMAPNQSINLQYAITWGLGDSSNWGYFPVYNRLDRLDELHHNLPVRFISTNEIPADASFNIFYLTDKNSWGIENKTAGLLEFDLFSITGKLLMEIQVNANTTNTISLNHYSRGIYFIREKNSGYSRKLYH